MLLAQLFEHDIELVKHDLVHCEQAGRLFERHIPTCPFGQKLNLLVKSFFVEHASTIRPQPADRVDGPRSC
ncbi:hypothetical protein D3C71_2081390 [compost metagenome]